MLNVGDHPERTQLQATTDMAMSWAIGQQCELAVLASARLDYQMNSNTSLMSQYVGVENACDNIEFIASLQNLFYSKLKPSHILLRGS